jgi:hypothetical protein
LKFSARLTQNKEKTTGEKSSPALPNNEKSSPALPNNEKSSPALPNNVSETISHSNVAAISA